MLIPYYASSPDEMANFRRFDPQIALNVPHVMITFFLFYLADERADFRRRVGCGRAVRPDQVHACAAQIWG